MLPQISTRSFLWLFLIVFVFFGFNWGASPARPITYVSRSGSGLASVAAPLSPPPLSPSPSPISAPVSPSQSNPVASAQTQIPISNPTPSRQAPSPVQIAQTVLTTPVATVAVPSLSQVSAPTAVPVVSPTPIPSTPAQAPASSASVGVLGYLQVFGGGGGSSGGGGGGSSGGGGGGGSTAPPPDTTSPDAPIILSPAFPYSASTSTLTVVGTAEVGSFVSESRGGSETTATGGSWTLNLILPEGTTTIEFIARDVAGNDSEPTSKTFFVDTVAPTSPTILSPQDETQASTTEIIFSGKGEAFSVISQDFDSATTTVDIVGDWMLALSLPQGTTTISFVSTDFFGNPSLATSRTIFIDSIPPDAPSITSPSPLPATSEEETVAFTGTAQALSLISQDFDSATTTVDAFGDWSLSLTLAEGDSTISFFATDALGNISNATSATITVSLVSVPEAPSISVAECGLNSLSAEVCLSATTVLSLTWNAVDGAEEYEIYENDVSLGATTSLAFTVSASDQATSTLFVVARNDAGSATSSSVAVEVFTSPLVINEIAWMGMFGTAGDPDPSPNLVTDEWIELYNRTGRTLRLTGVSLSASNFSIDLEGSLDPFGLFLLERDDDTTVDDIVADQIYGNDTADFDLNDDGDQLVLRAQGMELDKTPAVNPCSGWCAGDVPDAVTMERIDPATSGTNKNNWKDNDDSKINGIDAEGVEIFGTPREENSTGSGSPGGCIGACGG